MQLCSDYKICLKFGNISTIKIIRAAVLKLFWTTLVLQYVRTIQFIRIRQTFISSFDYILNRTCQIKIIETDDAFVYLVNK